MHLPSALFQQLSTWQRTSPRLLGLPLVSDLLSDTMRDHTQSGSPEAAKNDFLLLFSAVWFNKFFHFKMHCRSGHRPATRLNSRTFQVGPRSYADVRTQDMAGHEEELQYVALL